MEIWTISNKYFKPFNFKTMAKYKTYDEAVAALEAKKTALKEAKEEKRTFMAENGIKKNSTPDEKLTKKLEKMDKTIDDLTSAIETIREDAKELKPKKERTTKYEYPDGMTDDEKKKFRAKQRRAAKAGEEGAEEKPKKEKKEKKGEEAVGEKKPAKKVIKKKEEAEEED